MSTSILIRYKCRQCGRIFEYEVEDDIDEDLEQIKKNTSTWRDVQETRINSQNGVRIGDEFYPVVMTHVCSEMKIGFGDIIGIDANNIPDEE